MGFRDMIGHALLDNDELHFHTDVPPLTPTETWLVTLGAPLAAFNGSHVDALDGPVEDREALAAGIGEMWGIHDRASFEQTARRLVEEGQRKEYFLIWQALLTMQEVRKGGNFLLKIFASPVIEMQAHKRADAVGLAAATGMDRAEITAKFVASQFWVPDLDAALKVDTAALRSLVAWDAVRLVNITRWAVQLGWIAREEFVTYADGLSNEVRQAHSSWSEIAAAYVVAGLIWNHSESREENLVRTTKMLIDDKRSPYKRVPFR